MSGGCTHKRCKNNGLDSAMWILVVWATLNGVPIADTFAFSAKSDCEAARAKAIEILTADPKLHNPGAFCVDTRTKYI